MVGAGGGGGGGGEWRSKWANFCIQPSSNCICLMYSPNFLRYRQFKVGGVTMYDKG